MDSPPKLSGETLIVHHIPLVHCQVSGGGSRQGGVRCGGGSLKRSNPFGPAAAAETLGLSRTTSLPERDVLQREALVYSSLIHTRAATGATGAGRGGGGSTASDDSSYASSNSEDLPAVMAAAGAHTLPRTKPRKRANPLRHNPFLLNTEDDEDEEEEEEEDDDDGDNLNGYLEDSSFHLHGDANSALGDGAPPFRLHDLGFDPEPFLLHGTLGKAWGSGSHESLRGVNSDLSARLDDLDLDLLGLDGQHRRHGSSGSNMSMDCGEQEWGEEEEDDDDDEEEEERPVRGGRSSKRGSSSGSSARRCSCCRLSQADAQQFPEPFSECQLGYGSDSSCNSSDGVLVNFSAIFNKMNNSVPAKPATAVAAAVAGATNLNGNSAELSSCTSSVVSEQGGGRGGGAFYLDLHTSPTELPRPPQHGPGNALPPLREPPPVDLSSATAATTCTCSAEHQGALDLDANCNSYGQQQHPPHSSSAGDLASCLQSRARLVVAATQNYYKLVTCDLSSQSSPSPLGSSVTSCSDEQSKGSPTPTPTPTQPTEYFLFRHREEGAEEEEEEQDRVAPKHEDHDDDDDDDEEEEEQRKAEQQAGVAGTDPSSNVIEGQVYVNISPPVVGRGAIGGGSAGASGGRPRSRSYDRHLDKTSPPRLGSLERMLSCPVRLSEAAAPNPPPPPPRVTSFAEIARSKRRNGGGSPSQRTGADPFSPGHSSAEFSPVLEGVGLPPVPFTRCYSQGSAERSTGARDARARTEGDASSCSDLAVVRYSKDQRPTTLPIQPFTFQHQFSRPPPKPLLPLLTGYVSGMKAAAPCPGSSAGPGGREGEDDGESHAPQDRSGCSGAVASSASVAPGSVRPSPLGSYSPVRLQGGAPSSGTCSTCTPSPPQPPRSLSCPLSAGLLPLHTPPGAPKRTPAAMPTTPPPPHPPLGAKRERPVPPALPPVHCYHRGALHSLPALPSDSLSPLGQEEEEEEEETSGPLEGGKGPGPRPHNAHHLSPQALKWREYRRRNPLGVERVAASSVAPPLDGWTGGATRHARRNVFDFPPAPGHGRGLLDGQSVKQLQQYYSDFLPDYFSVAERPPDEFCLSPDPSSSSSSSSSSHSQVSVDLQQKRGLVKAINTAVDLIVAHFGTSRDPDVKAKLGNSWVSPNVGHLILKYLCPALREVLQDGLKAYVLDLIIGQRRNQPWSLVEASTQLGPSTRMLHSLFSKVSQYSELTSHSMRLNAFIFGLLNLRSLEFWFNHLYTHEDIIAAHFHPWGFLPLSQGPCQPLFEELLLLLQPLSLLPFDLDLLFEPCLFQKGREHLRRKEQLCSAGQGLDQSARSTFQLMRGWSATVAESLREGAESRLEGAGKKERGGLRREGTWPGMEGMEGSRRAGTGQRLGLRKEGAGTDSEGAGLGRSQPMTEVGGGFANLWRERGSAGQRAKGVGGESQREEGEKEKKKGGERDWSEEGRQRQERQAGWWYQLMQSSQVYIDQSAEGSKFTKSEKRKKLPERHHGQLPPAREGVVEGAESSQELRGRSRKCSGSSSGGSRGGKPVWMGSPPESVLLCQERSEDEGGREKNKAQGPQGAPGTGSQPAGRAQEEASSQGMRWGRLFGASLGSPSRSEGAEQRKAKVQRSRLPSGWLSLDRSVLGLVAQTVGVVSVKGVEPSAPPLEAETTPFPPREVRALCHHIATEPGQLSFHKGDVLQVLSRADPDWLLCSLGAGRGLVPIIYVTLRGLEDSQGPAGPH